MDFASVIVNAVFIFAFSIWVLVHFRCGNPRLRNTAARGSKWLVRITIFSNAVLPFLYCGFAVDEYLNSKFVCWELAISALTWSLAAAIAIYWRNGVCHEGKPWPMILVVWWVFSCFYGLGCLILFLLTHLKSMEIPRFLPKPTIVDCASFTLCLIICCTALTVSYSKNHNDLEKLLLQTENVCSSEDHGGFVSPGLWSQITFRWMNPLFKKGRIQKLELAHVPCVPQSETAEYASMLLEESLERTKIESSSLPKAIVLATWKPLVLTAIFAGVNTLASFMGPVLITNFVNYLLRKDDDSSNRDGLILAFFFFFAKTLESLTQRQCYFGTHRLGIQIRAALTVMIYKKCVSINAAGPSNGKITNLINVDVERIGDFSWYIHKIWLLPVQVVLALVILYMNLGLAPSITALLAIVFIMVGNTPLASIQESLHSKIMDAKDSRIKLTSETLRNMRVLKLHSWEQTFLKKILKLRDVERGWLKRYLYTCSVIAVLFWVSPTLVSVVTFGACVLMNVSLTAGTVLSAIATFRILQEPIYNLPELVSMIAQTKVSLDRIDEFIREEDQRKQIYYPPSSSSDIMVEIEVGEYSWDASDRNVKPAITVAEKMQIPKGYKVAVCGSVGSGKSSFLCSILGEIPQISGTQMKVHGTKAYVPQTAWIQSGTVRENVLFGKEIDERFYGDVLEGCALDQDIKLWLDGDCTLLGERGLNLSGGQKQRIQLARAVYSDADVYFLDDPFSAVDACTGTHLFKRCLLQLLSDKTVLYATHHLEFIEAADLVLVMKNGHVVQSGKYAELISDSNGELARHIAAHKKSLNGVKPFKEDKPHLKPCQMEAQDEKSSLTLGNGDLMRTQEEESQTGRVKWSVYSTFITSAYRGTLVPVVLLCQVFFQILQMGSNYWISWATEEEGKVSREQLIGIFILMSGVSSVFILGRAIVMATIAIETAQRMFLGMVTSIFAAPISFFDVKPSSQILNRSSNDQSTLDTDIPYRLGGLAFALIQLLSIIILMSKVAWHVFPLFLVVLAISIWYQGYYISTARELARMVGIRKAPILHHFSETVVGATIIRCFNQEDRFLTKILELVDDHSRIVFHNSTSMEWLCLRINFLFDAVFVLVLIILVTLPRSAINPSLAGLAATYGLNLNVLQSWVIWNLCNVENKMISVERVLQFTNIASEEPAVVHDCRPMPEWLKEGNIELEDLHVQYRPNLPMVLKGITCTFPKRKKIGVVGRTGSGKSTLIQALFRMVEPFAGRILIDGVDIAKMGLHDLRSRLGIIPQDPTLFKGTMRTNLDPLQQHTDQEIWEVLRKCRFAEIFKTDQTVLEAPVAEGGENWSVGQRQLVCLARVLLKKRRILVLDEATASIDTATENIIQETIREETKGCTVITVAHRIPTVIDNDLVLVLDEGKVVEYDKPSRLLENSSSSFSKLVAEFLRRSSSNSHSQTVEGS
ncbi:putative ABC transporter C family member 15 [Cucurbita moschata]|uniref:ABC-type xenobiotic transporter n=1 Tax=Cucurbita moschata TaxID=3662 RepID=A0A6J1FZE2_CUCMO|nr:putative ABC transporter C family member 15 [Cucurbita moschata]